MLVAAVCPAPARSADATPHTPRNCRTLIHCTFDLVVAGANASVDGRADGDLCGGARHERADLRHEHYHTGLHQLALCQHDRCRSQRHLQPHRPSGGPVTGLSRSYYAYLRQSHRPLALTLCLIETANIKSTRSRVRRTSREQCQQTHPPTPPYPPPPRPHTGETGSGWRPLAGGVVGGRRRGVEEWSDKRHVLIMQHTTRMRSRSEEVGAHGPRA